MIQFLNAVCTGFLLVFAMAVVFIVAPGTLNFILIEQGTCS